MAFQIALFKPAVASPFKGIEFELVDNQRTIASYNIFVGGYAHCTVVDVII